MKSARLFGYGDEVTKNKMIPEKERSAALNKVQNNSQTQNVTDKKYGETQSGAAQEAQAKRKTHRPKNSVEHRMSVVAAMYSGQRGANTGSLDLVGEEKEAQDPEIQKHVQ